MLTDRLRIVKPEDQIPEVEDIYASSLGLIFTDDLRNEHGDPGDVVVFKSSKHGEISLTLADPSGEDERRLFAHYLWNAGVYTAVKIEEGDNFWNVKEQNVLELGAGLGLASIVSCLEGAKTIAVTDYPAKEVLENIEKNIDRNIEGPSRHSISIQGHQWGVFEPRATLQRASFTRIFAADCLWMPWEHESLAKSMSFYLSDDEGARVFVVAGFHTGRAKMAPFFDVVEQEGLAIDSIWEEDVEGNRREWARERDGGREDVTGRKRWLAVAILKRARSR